MPKRAGRPRGSQPPKKSISIRLSASTVQLLEEALTQGLVATRQDAINRALEIYLGSLLARR
jgi:hypothetical protein